MQCSTSRVRGFVLLAAGFGGIATAGCQAPAAPAEPATLLVTNATCLQGTCQPIEVRAFPSNQPQTPGGFWAVELGSVVGEQACLTIPATAEFLIVAVAGNERDTTVIEWNTSMAMALGSNPAGPVLIPDIRPSTESFVPSGAGGWRVTLPADGTTAVAAAPACRLE
ncbi:MAG: hypothetical protein R2882_09805 [Gemmatimonadales bacterium]